LQFRLHPPIPAAGLANIIGGTKNGEKRAGLVCELTGVKKLFYGFGCEENPFFGDISPFAPRAGESTQT
jgi:hypothetical protein